MPAKKEETKKSEVRVLSFELGEKEAVWKSKDGSISLSRFTGAIKAQVKSDDQFAYENVVIGIRTGRLKLINESQMKVKVAPEQVVDLTNKVEDGIKLQSKAVELLKKMQKADLLEHIRTINHPILIAKMIELESAGKNISRRAREGIIEALKIRLDEINKKMASSGMVSYEEETDREFHVKKEEENNDKF